MEQTDPVPAVPTLRDVIRMLRPTQWTKNAVVLAAFVFALGDPAQHVGWAALQTVIPAAALFCLLSSGIYILNDLADIAKDRAHPLKRLRPLPAGRIAPAFAATVSVLLLTATLAAAFVLAPAFGITGLAYVVLQVFYTFLLKRVALLDIMIIAAGFVLRAIAGAVVLRVEISSWLLLCTFFLALFLALCKRRHEKLNADADAASRPTLEKYDERLLDQLIAVVSATTVVAYSIYTLSPATIEKFGTARLGFTIPFVVFGIFRYLDLAYRKEQGDRPEKILLSDIPLLVDLLLYGLTVLVVFLLRGV